MRFARSHEGFWFARTLVASPARTILNSPVKVSNTQRTIAFSPRVVSDKAFVVFQNAD